MVITEDFTKDMKPVFAEHYNECLPFLREAVDSVLPKKSTDEWLSAIIGPPHFEWDHDAVTENILTPINSYLHRTGKLFRPYLVALCLEAYNLDREKYKQIIGIAEIIHSASLMADDITDDSELRRGRKTAHKEYGIATAGISCFSMLNIGSSIFAHKKYNLPIETRLRLNHELVWEHYVTGIGTAIDLGWAEEKRTTIDLPAYFDSILYRSCSYTYRMPLKIGAIVANVESRDYKSLVEFGESTGLAFQLIDDILNVAPRHTGWGKKRGEDITAGKRSLLVLNTLQAANPGDKKRLLQILDSGTEDESYIREAVEIMEKYHSFQKSLNKSREFIAALDGKINDLAISPRYKSIFNAFAEYVVCRRI
jgi:geranylgeranyl pyrophosphate synthase